MISKKTNSSRLVSVVLLSFMLIANACRQGHGDSTTMQKFADEDHRDMKSIHFYPSTIRMLAKVLGDSIGTSLSGIERGRLFFNMGDDTNQEKLDSKLILLKTEIRAEGFESLMNMRSKGTDLDIYAKEGETPTYVIFAEEQASKYILELQGELTMENINAISKLDFDKAASIFNFNTDPDKDEIHDQSTKND